MKTLGPEKSDLEPAAARRSRLLDVILRIGAIALLFAGAAIGVSHSIAIGLLALGVALVGVLESRKHRPRRRAH